MTSYFTCTTNLETCRTLYRTKNNLVLILVNFELHRNVVGLGGKRIHDHLKVGRLYNALEQFIFLHADVFSML